MIFDKFVLVPADDRRRLRVLHILYFRNNKCFIKYFYFFFATLVNRYKNFLFSQREKQWEIYNRLHWQCIFHWNMKYQWRYIFLPARTSLYQMIVTMKLLGFSSQRRRLNSKSKETLTVSILHSWLFLTLHNISIIETLLVFFLKIMRQMWRNTTSSPSFYRLGTF